MLLPSMHVVDCGVVECDSTGVCIPLEPDQCSQFPSLILYRRTNLGGQVLSVIRGRRFTLTAIHEIGQCGNDHGHPPSII